jgi:hypothetical protein
MRKGGAFLKLEAGVRRARGTADRGDGKARRGEVMMAIQHMPVAHRESLHVDE